LEGAGAIEEAKYENLCITLFSKKKKKKKRKKKE
jgi:hypothetical protein